jgi:putative component of toxin-antitoxin plasmid stabilization module
VFTLEFYADERGREPFAEWLDGLSESKRAAMLAALRHVLGRVGLDVCRTEYGKSLGGGLYEFRLRQDEATILGKHASAGEADAAVSGGERILLRAFFHPHGDKLILLLGGHDKGRRPQPRAQAAEIERARRRLDDWRRRRRSRVPPTT